MVQRLTFSILSLLLLTIILGGCTTGKGRTPQQNAKGHYLTGLSALGENKPTEALQEFLLAQEIDDSDADIQAGLAQAYMQKRAFDLAEKHFLRSIELSKGSPQTYNNLGALYLTMERYDDALKAFRAAAENLLFANPETAWTGMGYACFSKRDYAAAERYYLKARELNPRYYQAVFRLGELYYDRGREGEAFESFAKTVEMAPRFMPGQYWLGVSAMKINDNERARKAFQETIKLAPESEQARLAKNYLKILH